MEDQAWRHTCRTLVKDVSNARPVCESKPALMPHRHERVSGSLRKRLNPDADVQEQMALLMFVETTATPPANSMSSCIPYGLQREVVSTCSQAFQHVVKPIYM